MARKIEEKNGQEEPITINDMPAPEESAVSAPVGWRVERALKLTRLPLMRGEDVKGMQKELIARGYACGMDSAEGVFGKDTERAVRAFQGSVRIPVNGIAGKKTVEALGGVWMEWRRQEAN
jgi:peptidoglycan hydrolase-like protein with peptidoglycan-binding domain